MNVSASLSGLFAAQNRFDVAANDIANANTPGHLDQRAELAEGPGGGVRVEAISKSGDPASPVSNVSLSDEMTELITAKHMYGANAQVVRSLVDVQGTVFDQRV